MCEEGEVTGRSLAAWSLRRQPPPAPPLLPRRSTGDPLIALGVAPKQAGAGGIMRRSLFSTGIRLPGLCLHYFRAPGGAAQEPYEYRGLGTAA